MGKADWRQSGLAEVRSFVGGVYGEDLHAKRIASLAGATLGVMRAASLAVAMIGQALAQARGLVTHLARGRYEFVEPLFGEYVRRLDEASVMTK